MKAQIKRIAIIGNGGGGKTTLAHLLAKIYELPLNHVDSIQFLAGMDFREERETAEILRRLASQDSWLIDGFGSMEIMQERFVLADRVIFVDFPLWRHYWWCTKRQVKSIWRPRAELPPGCDEATISYTIKLYKILWRVHRVIKPKLKDFFDQPEMQKKVIRISNMKQWLQVSRGNI